MIVRTSKNKCFSLQAARREAQREMALMAAEDVRSIERQERAEADRVRQAERDRFRHADVSVHFAYICIHQPS